MTRLHVSGRWLRVCVQAKRPIRIWLNVLVAAQGYRYTWESLSCEVREVAFEERPVVLWVLEADEMILQKTPDIAVKRWSTKP